MTQAYSQSIAQAYSRIWGTHGRRFAKQCVTYLGARSRKPRTALDLACGTGSIASVLLENGIGVIGIDRSTHMLDQAATDCALYVDRGLVTFELGDMRAFHLERPVDLVVSCYDAVNHLASGEDLTKCFDCAADALVPGGSFAFDLKTIRGLEDWDGVKIQDRSEFALISRGFFNADEGRAWKKLSGFYEVDSGVYRRFEQLIFNTAFPVSEVISRLDKAGFSEIAIREAHDFSQPLPDPEKADRIAVIARK